MIGERGVMVVRRCVLEQACGLLRSAMSGLATELEPSLPVPFMIRFGLTTNLIGEAESSTPAQHRVDTLVQRPLVFDVMKADGADDEIKGSCREVEVLEPLCDEIPSLTRRSFRGIEA